ncbi:MAG: TIGR03936 family radical SAM-associated protein [Dehalococcoidia bacterium]
MTAQRFRVWFRKGERVRYISHLDVLRYWERCLRRAELPLSYSQGFTPHPKLGFAGPLPLGYLAEAEVVDVTLDERVAPAEFEARLAAETSEDLGVVRVAEIPFSTPPPQAALLWADYRVDLPAVEVAAAADGIADFLAVKTFPWTDERREKARTYDLRAAVASLTAAPIDGGVQLTMRLQATSELMARPEQLIAALFPEAAPMLITRVGLIFDEPSPAHDAWRRRGRFEG